MSVPSNLAERLVAEGAIELQKLFRTPLPVMIELLEEERLAKEARAREREQKQPRKES